MTKHYNYKLQTKEEWLTAYNEMDDRGANFAAYTFLTITARDEAANVTLLKILEDNKIEAKRI